MANRVMAAKARKLRAQKRRSPRRMDLDKKGPRPSREVLAEYRQRAKGLGMTDAEVSDWIRVMYGRDPFTNTPSGKYEINTRKEEVLQKFNDPLFVQHLDNPMQRIRIFFNSRQDKVVIQQWLKQRHLYRLSIAYSCIEDAYTVLQRDSITWRTERYLRSASG